MVLESLPVRPTLGVGPRMKIDDTQALGAELDLDRAALLTLYRNGKAKQWDAESRLDWSHELDPDNPLGMAMDLVPIVDLPLFDRMSDASRNEVRRHYQAWSISQFMHGEEGALACAGKIVHQVPDLDARLFAATQAIDEARHVEAYRALVGKIGLSYPLNRPLRALLEQVIGDSRWDMTYLGMQVVIEGLGLASFAAMRDTARDPLVSALNAYVMADEARHVAFGRLTLRAYYPQLTQAERDEREEFLVEACHLMRDRFDGADVWQTLGLPVVECIAAVRESEAQSAHRAALFGRILPVIRDIGLWGDKARGSFARMGLLAYAGRDPQADHVQDEQRADEFAARRAYVAEVASA